ncbi:MAG TPA: protein kinase [Planctomycetaceae bacterium]|jgi:serine/threonine-protein kinase
MKPSILPCDRQSLGSFLADTLSAQEEIAFEKHLENCTSCRAALDEMVATPQAWKHARIYLSDPIEIDPDRSVAGNFEFCRQLLGPTDDPAMLGRVGGYEIVGILGAGGMGVVFKGFDVSLNRFVAIKMLSPLLNASGNAKQRFIREAQSAAAVIHDNVIAIHSIDQWQGSPYLVMTYVRGESLRSRLSRRGALSLREVLRLGMQIASGLAAAHAQGLIHRDIKPANILLETDVDRLKISDFGLARTVDDIRLTKSDMLLGTPQYMSPEQARDEPLDFRTDLFSLGSVLYEACTGRPPFQASTSYGVLRRIVECRPLPIRQLNADVPEWLERLVSKLMEKDREARISSAAELESLLKQCLAHVEQPLFVSLPESVAAPSARFSIHSRRFLMSLTAISLVTTVIWLVLAQVGSTGKQLTTDSNGERPAAAPESPAADRPTVEVENYRIEVLGTADVSEMPMTTEFDLSRMKVKQQFNTFGNAAAGGSVGGSAGGAGGGFGARFLKPNLGIALKIEPIKKESEAIVKVASKAKAVDDRGNAIESSDLGPSVNHFARFENSFPGSQALYLHRSSRDASKLVRLEGELFIIPGRKLSVRFDGTKKKQTQRAGKEAFTLESVNTTVEGTEISVAFPPLKIVSDARTPQERFEAMVANRGSYSATIEDSVGEVHQSTTSTTTGVASSSFSTTGFSTNGTSVQGVVKTPDNPSRSFGFAPLPAGRSIKAIHVSLEERTGEPHSVAFTLENIELK